MSEFNKEGLHPLRVRSAEPERAPSLYQDEINLLAHREGFEDVAKKISDWPTDLINKVGYVLNINGSSFEYLHVIEKGELQTILNEIEQATDPKKLDDLSRQLAELAN